MGCRSGPSDSADHAVVAGLRLENTRQPGLQARAETGLEAISDEEAAVLYDGQLGIEKCLGRSACGRVELTEREAAAPGEIMQKPGRVRSDEIREESQGRHQRSSCG